MLLTRSDYGEGNGRGCQLILAASPCQFCLYLHVPCLAAGATPPHLFTTCYALYADYLLLRAQVSRYPRDCVQTYV